jgi:HTH-type transcriptional regulator / antitoxin HigA
MSDHDITEQGPISTDSLAYVELLTTFPSRPIKSAIECDQVQAVIDRLLDTPKLSAEQQDYLNLLGLLIEDYETQFVPISDILWCGLAKGFDCRSRAETKRLSSNFQNGVDRFCGLEWTT